MLTTVIETKRQQIITIMKEGSNKYILHAFWIGILNLCEFPAYINSNRRHKSKKQAGKGWENPDGWAWFVFERRWDGGRGSAWSQRLLRLSVRRLCFSQGGVFYFLEHVAADRSSWRYFWQQVCYPTWKLVFAGCCLTREIWKNLEQASFSELKLQHISVPLPWTPIQPHIIGYAVK